MKYLVADIYCCRGEVGLNEMSVHEADDAMSLALDLRSKKIEEMKIHYGEEWEQYAQYLYGDIDKNKDVIGITNGEENCLYIIPETNKYLKSLTEDPTENEEFMSNCIHSDHWEEVEV